MIIVRYCGGLGNQMYQYALSCVLEDLYPAQEIKADISHYEFLREHNGFEVKDVFGLDIKIATHKEIVKIYPGLTTNRFFSKLPKYLKKFMLYSFQYRYNKVAYFIHRTKKKYLISGLGFNIFNDVVLHLNEREHYYFNGLWQNVNYFAMYEEKIRNRFKFSVSLYDEENVILKEIQGNESVGIHVRRGDFVNSKFDICSFSYYKSAYDVIRAQIKNDNIKYYIFTDDKRYVEEHFGTLGYEKIISSDKEKAYKDLYYMSMCKHNIISNSTFAFWAAFLNNNSGKIVVCPKYCLRDEIGLHEFSTPADWIKLDVE